MTSENKREFKIVLIGDAGCGKTTFLNRFINGDFEKRYLYTLGVEVTPFTFNTNDGEYKISFWDTAGQEKYGGLGDGYYRDSDLAIVFFDLTSKISFKNVKQWVDSYHNICPNNEVIIVGNKFDIKEQKVKFNEIKKNIKSTYFSVSAKSNYNFDKPFLYSLRKVTNNYSLTFVESEAIEQPLNYNTELSKL